MTGTYRNFIVNRYNDLTPSLKKTISRKKYLTEYPLKNGFSDWLESLRSAKLSTGLVHSIAKTFIRHGKRSPSEIPMILASISREYDIEIPCVGGIMSAEYWESRITTNT